MKAKYLLQEKKEEKSTHEPKNGGLNGSWCEGATSFNNNKQQQDIHQEKDAIFEMN